MKTLNSILRPTRQLVLAGLVAALAGLLASCASIDSQSTQYVGAPHQLPSDPAKVVLLRTEPTRPHDRLGEVLVEASTDPAPPIEEVEKRLREQAAKIGADAVVIVLDRIQPTGMYVTGGWWNQSLEAISGRKLIGVAIKYKP